MSEELKPCPFCGSKDTRSLITLGWRFVGCDRCGARGPKALVETDSAGDKVININLPTDWWNTRHTEQGWISVEDRLPELQQGILTFEGDPDDPLISIEYPNSYQLACLSGEEQDVYWSCVTHWMPLPSPPQASEVEG